MQGFNMGRYRAPADLDRSLEPGRGVSRLSKGPNQDTIRFEMPFDIRCATCPPSSVNAPIRQGVRFNAIKKKVGNYYSTPIWSFRMKHTFCGAWFEMRTDPQTHDFIVTEGAKKRNFGEDPVPVDRSDEALLRRLDPRISDEQKEKDAFAAYEDKAADKTQAKNDGQRIDELKALRDRDWRDPDATNRRLRDSFRAGRRARDAQARHDDNVVTRYSLDIKLLAPSEADAKQAALVDYGTATDDPVATTSDLRLYRKPFLKGGKTPTLRGGHFGNIQDEVVAHTRAAMDPFNPANAKKRSLSSPSLGVKRRLKSVDKTSKSLKTTHEAAEPGGDSTKQVKSALVEYDDSD